MGIRLDQLVKATMKGYQRHNNKDSGHSYLLLANCFLIEFVQRTKNYTSPKGDSHLKSFDSNG